MNPSQLALLNENAWLELREWNVFRFDGKDTQSFLQTKLTANVKRWRLKGGDRAFALDIKGKVIFGGEFRASKLGVFALCPPVEIQSAKDHMERYIIMEDVCMHTEEPYQLFALIGEAAIQTAASTLGFAAEPLGGEGGLELTWNESGLAWTPWHQGGAPAALILVPSAEIEATREALQEAEISKSDEAALRWFEVIKGVARTGVDLAYGKTIPLEAGAFDAVHFNKGCYLGQEVIERLHSRGRPAKRLCHFKWQGEALEGGTKLGVESAPDSNAGEVLRSVSHEGEGYAIAWVRRKALDSGEPIIAGQTNLGLPALIGGEDQ